MVWSLWIFALLGVIQLTYGREVLPFDRSATHMVRNVLPRRESEELNSAESSPAFYNVRDEDGMTESVVPDRDRSYYSSLLQDREPLSYFNDRQPSLNEEIQTEADLADLQNEVSETRPNDDHLSPEERFLFQKRLVMRGMGLVGSSKSKGLLGARKGFGNSPKSLLRSSNGRFGAFGGKHSLIGNARSRPKGLVLSIDLGIKALRDAIMHAKVKQKSERHHKQAQKNMMLLHSIGKRNGSPLSSGPSLEEAIGEGIPSRDP